MEFGEPCEIDEFEHVVIWLDQLPLSRPKKNINKDFSDGVLMAEVLKLFYPKLVELHNYIKTSSLTVKVDNWTVLNRKVLRKLNLKLSSRMIQDIAGSVPGAIQKLLVAVRQKVLDLEGTQREPDPFVDVSGGSGSCTDIVTVPITSPDNGKVVRQEHMVPWSVYQKKKRLLTKRDAEIVSLTERVSHLECMIKLKDQRIKDLNSQLYRYQTEAPTSFSISRR